MFNIIVGIDGLKILTKNISSDCKCKSDGRKCNSDQWWKNDKYQCECKKRHACEKDYIWNPATYSCKNEKYLASIMEDSVITLDEIIQSYDNKETKTILTDINEKKPICKTQNVYIYSTF